MALETRKQIPHFVVQARGRGRVAYAGIWQRKNLLLAVLPDETDASERYAAALEERRAEFIAHDTVLLTTADEVAGLAAPGIAIADRWGEIHFVVHGVRVEDLPPPDELIEWLHYVQIQCPECQGETR